MRDVRLSFDRARSAEFAKEFYATLLASDPRIRAKFERTNFAVQQEMLVHGVYALLDYVEGKAVGKMALERLARSHGPKKIGVTVDMYERWADAFLKTLRRTDPLYDDALDQRWRETIKPALETLAAKVEAQRQ